MCPPPPPPHGPPLNLRLCTVRYGCAVILTNQKTPIYSSITTEQPVTTERIVHGGCLIRNLCSVATERLGAVRSVLYREAMVVLGEVEVSLEKNFKMSVTSHTF